MKRMILLTACLLISGHQLFGQGAVTFCNNSSTFVTNSVTGLRIATSDGIKAALYWSPVAVNNFVQIGSVTTIGTPLPGLFAAGTRVSGNTTAGGAIGQFQVRAWGGPYATYEQAIQAGGGVLVGQSAILQISTGNTNSIPPTPASSLLSGGLLGFTLAPYFVTDIDIGLRVFDGTATIKIAIQNGTATSPLRISKNGTTYGILLVTPSDPNASKIHIQTSAGIMAWKKLP